MLRLSPRRRDNTAEQRPQKITLGAMRSTGLRNMLVYCGDYKCAHSAKINADRWGDDVRLSDLEPVFTCQATATAVRMSGRSSTHEGLAGEIL